jgi:drug/metabolite transporter (DMT)-like permease
MQSNSIYVRLAPWVFILVWSCGFVVAKYVTPYAPPLTFLAFRYLGIVLLLGTIAWAAKVAWPSGKRLWHTALAGVMMQAGYLAGCWMGIAQGMPAGVMALIVNLQPMLTAVFTVLFLTQAGQSSVSPRQWLGLALGFAGVALVLATKLGAVNYASFGWFAIVLAFGALIAITVGTLYQKQFCPGVDPRAGQAVQSAASLCVTLPFAWLLETQPVLWTTPLWGALVFSVVVLSGVGTGLLLWLINRGAATQVTAYLYWVPPVSSVLAWVMFDERIALLAWPGFALVAAGVYLVVKTQTPNQPSNAIK